MIVLRAILLLIFSIFFVGLSWHIASSGKSFSLDDIAFLLLFLVVILILGPFWLTKERQARFSEHFQRYPRIYGFMFWIIMVGVSFHYLFDTYLYPGERPSGRIKYIYDLFGSEGLMAFWLWTGGLSTYKCYMVFKRN